MMIVGPNTYRQIVSQLISCEKTSNQSKIELTAVENGRPKSGTTIFEIMSAGIVTQIYVGTNFDLRFSVFRKYQEKLKEIIKGNDRDFPVLGHFLANFFGFFHLRSQDIGED